MPRFYLLRPDGTYSDAADYPSVPPTRLDGTWVPGLPGNLPRRAELSERLKAIFEAALPQVVDIRLKAHFRGIQATVAVCLECNDAASAKYVIQNAKQPDGADLPINLKTVQAALLAEFDK